jgi:DNA-binding transcriptional ArsR family regulator
MLGPTAVWEHLFAKVFAMTPREPTRVQMWAMAHPLRLQLIALLGEGPSTASRLARRLGESSGATSYHLRVLARVGAIVEDPELGTRRERWWRRPERFALMPTDADAEGRAITARMLGLFFARDEEARRRFVTQDVDAAWHEGAFVGNWFVELTPEEADELGRRLLALVRERRDRTEATPGASRALVSISVLPWLD